MKNKQFIYQEYHHHRNKQEHALFFRIITFCFCRMSLTPDTTKVSLVAHKYTMKKRRKKEIKIKAKAAVKQGRCQR